MDEIIIKELVEQLKQLNRKLDNINKQVFTTKEAAKYLCMGYDTILRLARIGQIEYVANGASYIFKKEYLDRWLDKNKKVIL